MRKALLAATCAILMIGTAAAQTNVNRGPLIDPDGVYLNSRGTMDPDGSTTNARGNMDPDGNDVDSRGTMDPDGFMLDSRGTMDPDGRDWLSYMLDLFGG